MYHREHAQEAFLVLAGECTLVVEGDERRLTTWDSFHCAPRTEHIVVAAGDQSAVVPAVGARGRGVGGGIVYPVSDVAARYGASVVRETSDPAVAYADVRKALPRSRFVKYGMKANRSMPSAAVIPVLVYPDVREAVDWLSGAFGFVERVRIGEDHRSQLRFGAGAVIVADVRNERRPPSPGEVTHSVVVRVDDVNAHCERARAHGARIVIEPVDFEYGERQYTAGGPPVDVLRDARRRRSRDVGRRARRAGLASRLRGHPSSRSGWRAQNAASAAAIPGGFSICRKCVVSGTTTPSAFGSQSSSR